jgi:hypothetical protein
MEINWHIRSFYKFPVNEDKIKPEVTFLLCMCSQLLAVYNHICIFSGGVVAVKVSNFEEYCNIRFCYSNL